MHTKNITVILAVISTLCRVSVLSPKESTLSSIISGRERVVGLISVV